MGVQRVIADIAPVKRGFSKLLYIGIRPITVHLALKIVLVESPCPLNVSSIRNFRAKSRVIHLVN
jgi:hypothetical protein